MATRTRYAPDRGLTVRMTATMFLLGLVFVVFVGLVIGIMTAAHASAAAIILVAVVFGGGSAFISLFYSDKIALAAALGLLLFFTYLTAVRPAYAFAYALCLLFLIAWVWPRLAIRGISLTRRLDPGTPTVGESYEEVIEVSRSGAVAMSLTGKKLRLQPPVPTRTEMVRT